MVRTAKSLMLVLAMVMIVGFLPEQGRRPPCPRVDRGETVRCQMAQARYYHYQQQYRLKR